MHVGPEIAVSGSTIRKVRAVAQEDVAVVVKKGIEKQLVTDVEVPKDLSAPAIVAGHWRGAHQAPGANPDQNCRRRAGRDSKSQPHLAAVWALAQHGDQARAHESMVDTGMRVAFAPPGLPGRPQARGTEIDPLLLAQLQPGLSTKEDVLRVLGVPTRNGVIQIARPGSMITA